MKSQTFIEMCVRGETSPANINAFVEAWHVAPGEERSLRECLGLTEQEYANWVANPESLVGVVERRHPEAQLAKTS